MRDLFTVASFTIKEMVKKKSFIVSNIIFLVLILVGTNVPRLLESLNGKIEGKKVLIVDSKNIFEDSLDTLKNEYSIYDLSITKDTYDKDKIKSVLENGDYEEVIVLDVDNQKIIFDDYQEEASLNNVSADDLMSLIANIYYGINLSKIGLSEEQLSKLNITFEINNIYIKENNSGNSISAMMMFSIVLFYAVFFCANQVSSSVTTEKTSKIIESLTTSTSPKYIVLGKTLGVGVVGLFESQRRFNLFKSHEFEIMYLNKRVSYFKDYAEQRPSLNPPFSSVYICSKMLPKTIVFEEIDK